jgi:outer membrane usher protein
MVALTGFVIALGTVQSGTVAAASPSAPIARSETQEAEPITLALPLTLDGRYVGDINVRIAGDDISFDGARFLELIQPDLVAATLEEIRARMIAGRLTPASASTGAVRVNFDPALQELAVSSVANARNRRQIDLRPGAGGDSSPVVTPEPVAFFINGAFAYDHILENRANPLDRGRQPLAGTLEIGGRIGGERGVAFISRHAYQEGLERSFQRVETQLIYDNVESLIRVTAGDLRYRGANLQSLPRLAGISVERFFGLEPTRIYRPIGETSFVLERPSTVQVKINGLIFQELYLTGGQYDLRDLPLTQGANNVELLIRDDTGREQIITSNNFFDYDLLDEGVSDFSFAGGVRSRFDNGLIRYSDDWVGSGFFRLGLSQTVTAGVDIQGDRHGGTAGATGIWASPIGILRAQASVSHRDGFGTGTAAAVGYLATGRFDQIWRWSLRADAQHQSANFTTVSDLVQLGPGGIVRNTSSRFSGNAQINNQRLTLTASGEYEGIRGGRDRSSALIGGTYNVNAALAVGAFGRYIRSGERSDTGAFLQLTWAPGRNRLARASYDTSRDEAELNYRYSPPPFVGTTGYEVGLRRSGEQDRAELSGRISHVSNRFEASVQHDVFSTAGFASSQRVQVSRASIASAIVFAGGKVAISRPVREGFAIVSRHPSLAGKKILVDPVESGVRARTDALGAAVVPDLPSYSRTSVYVDVVDLPLGYDLGSGQFGFRAPLYSGYDVTVGSGASVTMIGMVYRANGDPVSLVGGSLVPLASPDAEPIPVFTNRTGRLVGIGLKPGKYRLTLLTDPPFTTEIDIPAGSEGLVNLGDIRVNQR